MESCKYRLPCGHCDKFNEPCPFLEKKIACDLEEATIREKQAKCIHEWSLIKTTWQSYPRPRIERCCECRKCLLKKYDYENISEV